MNLELLEREIRGLVSAETPAEVFRRLVEAAAVAAPRAAIFLARQGQVKGWGSLGYPPEVTRRQRAFAAAADSGWLAELASDPRGGMRLLSYPGLDPDFGQSPPAESVGIAVRVKTRGIAVLLAERNEGEEPWHPAALGILVAMAETRLELDLARKRLASRAGDAGESVSRTAAAPPEPAQDSGAIARAAALATADLTAVSLVEPDAVTPGDGDDPATEAARRFARLIATDIRLYNEDAVLKGRQDRTLMQRLENPIAQGTRTFTTRHEALGDLGRSILHEALVEVLAGGDASLLEAAPGVGVSARHGSPRDPMVPSRDTPERDES